MFQLNLILGSFGFTSANREPPRDQFLWIVVYIESPFPFLFTRNMMMVMILKKLKDLAVMGKKIKREWERYEREENEVCNMIGYIL